MSNNCFICSRIISGTLWKNSRILDVAEMSAKRRQTLREWCEYNNLTLNDADGSYICARDNLKITNDSLIKKVETQDIIEPSIVIKNIFQAPRSGSKCVICDKKVGEGCIKIPDTVRQDLLMNFSLFVESDSNCRICVTHLQGKYLKPDLKISKNFKEKAELTSDKASNLIHELLNLLRNRTPQLDFENPNSLSNEDYLLWTGWDKVQFSFFLSYLNGVDNSKNRTKREALAIYWIKLKTNLSHSHIASLFGFEDPNTYGRKIVASAFDSVLNSLNTYFAPFHIGVDHITNEEMLKHNTIYSKTFFGDKPTTIWDGTYLYIDKSTNFSKARQSYSMHKGRPLVKFMSIVFPDGYIVDSIGPFYSNTYNNDAGMTSEILRKEGYGILKWLKKTNQNVIADRGFQGVVSELENLGASVFLPSFNPKGSTQPTIQDSNRSRLVTKVRWVVEAHHSRFKKFKLFSNTQPILHVDKLRACLRVLSASLNVHRPLLNQNFDQKKHQKIAEKMLELSKIDLNVVELRVSKGTLSRRAKWDEKNINNDEEVEISSPQILKEFPKMTVNEIKEKITCGSYQVKLASKYINEHLESNGGFTFFVHKSAPDLIRVRMQSRHVRSTKHCLWVQFEPSNEEKNGEVTGWYCTCKAGRRLVGCCAHIASVIWFLGFARHQGYKLNPYINKYWKNVIDSRVVDTSDEE